MTRRVLCDENMPHKLRSALMTFDVATVKYMGFSGMNNGELLDAAEKAGFDVLVTGDKTLEYEQNISRRKIAVVSLSAPHWRLIRNHVARIALAIDGAAAGSLTRVECGAFVRPRRKPDDPSPT